MLRTILWANLKVFILRPVLIVIDMQKGLFSADRMPYDTPNIVGRINALSQSIRNSGGIVVFIQHEEAAGSIYEKESSGWQLLDELNVESRDVFVSKNYCDAFLDTELSEKVSLDDALIFCGCATDYCVDTSIRAALSKGYKVTVASDAHTLAHRSYMNAEKIIEHHNTVWGDFISPSGVAEIQETSNIVERLEHAK